MGPRTETQAGHVPCDSTNWWFLLLDEKDETDRWTNTCLMLYNMDVVSMKSIKYFANIL